MLISERRRQVLDLVRRVGSASIGQLCAATGVSESTVRRDLDELHQQGLLLRTRGGAMVTDHGGAESPQIYTEDPRVSEDVASRLGARAAALIQDGSTVMVLAGSTTAAMIPHLLRRRLTVVTNGLEVAFALRHAPHVSVVVLGGVLHREQMTLLGPMSLASMSSLNVEIMFAGAWGVDATAGVTGNKIIQAGQHELMLAHVDRLVVLADASKLGRRGPTRLARIDQLQTLITDRAAPPTHLDHLASAGVEVITA